MSLGVSIYPSQVCGFVLFIGLTFFIQACTKDSGEITIIPPPTHPLSRSVVGYGVIKVSFTRVLDNPNQTSASLGYLRRGSIVRVVERRSINREGTFESWVLVEGLFRGWLREEEREERVVDIYDLEAQAGTAAVVMNR
ncbi:MAG: hypothetical protein LBG73_06305 [Spirochaetaceae bacterium]|nr:hypothetical protein [Spirochaetaceae bacterium]